MDKGHGRREKRSIEVSDILKGYSDWPGLERVCRIERVRIIGDDETREVVYAVTSLTRGDADAERLLELSRAHWGIENRLHCVRDVTFDEDRCRVRSGSGPQVFAAIRNAVITMLRRLGFTNMAAGTEHFGEERAEVVKLLRYGTFEWPWLFWIPALPVRGPRRPESGLRIRPDSPLTPRPRVVSYGR